MSDLNALVEIARKAVRGMQMKEANKVFDMVLIGNVGLLSLTNSAQFGAAFMVPGGAGAKRMIKGLLFGFADALQISLQNAGVNIPSEFLLMLPYLLTLIALAGFIGRSNPPAAVGVPYEK